MSKASELTPRKSYKDQVALTPSKDRVTHANSRKRSSDVIIDANPIFVVLGLQKLPSEVKNVESSIAEKKPHTMTSLYLEPIKTPNVEPDVVTSAKGHVIANVVGSVGTSENLPLKL
ncbi:hypothetical protein KIW84_035665 [Lathyrus oleraceus]|uniref:Uncharacterized protein n=1 Tax=Pisum sativum TaxID=3888 RepID=A0A9D4Y3A8_PEA|nr:hypothetical protein KIW84_035665 [Pisum sativum]